MHTSIYTSNMIKPSGMLVQKGLHSCLFLDIWALMYKLELLFRNQKLFKKKSLMHHWAKAFSTDKNKIGACCVLNRAEPGSI